MRWTDTVNPVRMERVAVVAPADRIEDVLAALRDEAAVELDRVPEEASVHDASSVALRQGSVSALPGWAPSAAVHRLRDRIAPLGGALARLRHPAGVEPPTLIGARGPAGAFGPLVDTYAVVPYADFNPAIFAGLAYVVMFGMMFGDVADGALLAAAGLALRSRLVPIPPGVRRLAPFVVGGGLAAVGFGLAYGEAFGPTGWVPTLWLSPLDHPTTLLAVAVAAGAALLAVAYAFGTVNRWREGGARRALLATSGLAGASVYLGIGALALGWYEHLPAALAGGGVLAGCGLVAGFLGCYAEAGGAVQAAVELFDTVLRIGTNTVSFARLAAFGLTHAALSEVVWSGTTALWNRGGATAIGGVAVFVGGSALALVLEGLVAAVQALRLEYYELFSRIFTSEGRPFRPWRSPRWSR